MQELLWSHANAWARRHRFVGHVFQGRDRTELVEDETDLRLVTRYVHLNPVRPAWVADPAAWEWSSDPGHAHRRRRRDWVAHDDSEIMAPGTDRPKTWNWVDTDSPNWVWV